MVDVIDVIIVRCNSSLLVGGIYFSFLSLELFIFKLEQDNVFFPAAGIPVTALERLALLSDILAVLREPSDLPRSGCKYESLASLPVGE